MSTMSVHPERPQGEVFLDARGKGRAMRLTWHHEADVVVLSLWRDGTCAGTFRLSKDDVNEFIDALVDGVRDAPGVHVATSSGSHRASMDVTGQTEKPSPPARTTPPTTRTQPPPTAQPSMQPEFLQPGQPRPDDPPSFTDWAFDDNQRATAS